MLAQQICFPMNECIVYLSYNKSVTKQLKMQCLRGNTHTMSEFCLHAWSEGLQNQTAECFPKIESVGGVVAGIWGLVICLLGFVTNLLTIIAIPYAKMKT